MSDKISIKLLSEYAKIPTKATPGSNAYDLYTDTSGSIIKDEVKIITTGVAIALPKGYAGLVVPRSGLAAKHGISIVNTPGLIDSDYRGEIKLIMTSHSQEQFNFSTGDRLAQLLIIKTENNIEFKEVQDLSITSRGDKGLGSSGQ